MISLYVDAVLDPLVSLLWESPKQLKINKLKIKNWKTWVLHRLKINIEYKNSAFNQ